MFPYHLPNRENIPNPPPFFLCKVKTTLMGVLPEDHKGRSRLPRLRLCSSPEFLQPSLLPCLQFPPLQLAPQSPPTSEHLVFGDEGNCWGGEPSGWHPPYLRHNTVTEGSSGTLGKPGATFH